MASGGLNSISWVLCQDLNIRTYQNSEHKAQHSVESGGEDGQVHTLQPASPKLSLCQVT